MIRCDLIKKQITAYNSDWDPSFLAYNFSDKLVE